MAGWLVLVDLLGALVPSTAAGVAEMVLHLYLYLYLYLSLSLYVPPYRCLYLYL